MATWGPSKVGALITRSEVWEMTLDGSKLSITYQGRQRSGEPRKSGLTVTPGMFWSSVELEVSNENTLMLDGIPNALAKEMKNAIYAAHDAILLVAEKKKQLDKLHALLVFVRKWRDEVSLSYTSHKDNLIWLTHQTVTGWIDAIPKVEKQELKKLLETGHVFKAFSEKDETTRGSVRLMEADLFAIAKEQNQALLKSESVAHKDYFDTVEKSALPIPH